MTKEALSWEIGEEISVVVLSLGRGLAALRYSNSTCKRKNQFDTDSAGSSAE